MSIHLSPDIIRLLLVLAATIAAHYLSRRALQHAEQLRLAPHERRFVAAAITLGTIVGLLMAIAALWILRSAR